MSKNENVIEVEVNEATEQVEETVKESKFSKLKSGAKKYGKKILVGTGVAVGGLVCYALGKMSRGGNDTCDGCVSEVEVEFSPVESDE